MLYGVRAGAAQAEGPSKSLTAEQKKQLDKAENLDQRAQKYCEMGEYAKAAPLLLQLCDIRKKALGERHPDYAQGLNNLAYLYDLMGEYAKAEPLLLQACDIRRKACGRAAS